MNEALITRYRDGLGAIRTALTSVDLDFSHEGWTPREIVHHLADAELNRALRFRRLVTEDTPHLDTWEENDYADRLHYERPIETSLLVLESIIRSNIEFAECLSPAELHREGTHPDLGAVSVETMLERGAKHVHEHAEQIRACKR